MINRFPFDEDSDPFTSGFGNFHRRGRAASNSLINNFFCNDFGTMSNFDPSNRSSGQSYSSYSYSSYSSSSANGGEPIVISKTINESRKDGGVIERSETFQDSRDGTQAISVSRHIGDRGRTISKIRNKSSDEQTIDTLHNLEDEESMNQFDLEWNKLKNKNHVITNGNKNSNVQLLEDDDRGEVKSKPTRSSNKK